MPEPVGKEQVSQLTAFNTLSRFRRIEGKSVIEVGGNSNCVAATPFAQAGASRVVVTGLYHLDIEERPPHPLIALECADALKLSEKYQRGSFDLLYGISVLEHIPNPRGFFSEVYRILSTGGMAFLQGAPIWSGPWGHHIHLTPWQNGTVGCYQFLPSEVLLSKGVNVVNPIPDWGHILYISTEMAAMLGNMNIPESDIEKIIDFVYKGDVINRESAASICDAIRCSGLTIVELEYDRVQISGDMLERVRAVCGQGEDFSIMGMRVVLLKE